MINVFNANFYGSDSQRLAEEVKQLYPFYEPDLYLKRQMQIELLKTREVITGCSGSVVAQFYEGSMDEEDFINTFCEVDDKTKKDFFQFEFQGKGLYQIISSAKALGWKELKRKDSNKIGQ